MASWAIARPYGILAASITSTCGGQLGEQFRRREAVGDDDIGVGEQPPPPDGDQFRVARPAADQGHPAVHDTWGLARDEPLLERLMDRRPDRSRAPMLASGQHPHRQALVLERRRGDRGAFAAGVCADTEDLTTLGLVHDGGVDVRVVGGRDDIPGAFEVAFAKAPQRQRDSTHRLNRRRCGPGNDVDVRAGCYQKREAALRDGAAADDHDLPVGQSKADQIRVL